MRLGVIAAIVVASAVARAEKVPLVVALHCYGCAATELPDLLGLTALANAHRFVVAAPESGHVDSRGASYWNATEACCDFEGKRPDDVGAIVRLIDDEVKHHGVDPKRVYLVGFSNGAFLAQRVACEHADKIAAIVAIGGAGPTRCAPSSPVAVLEVHGRSDDVVPIDGPALGAGLPRRAGYPPVKETLATWARVDRCAVGAPGCAVQQWLFDGGHMPRLPRDFGERMWTWLTAQHK